LEWWLIFHHYVIHLSYIRASSSEIGDCCRRRATSWHFSKTTPIGIIVSLAAVILVKFDNRGLAFRESELPALYAIRRDRTGRQTVALKERP
jgi:hypothetical protein